MKKIVALLTALGIVSLSFVGHAQTVVIGRVNGAVSASQKPVESASVALLRAKDSSVAKLAVSDKSGQFDIDNVKLGKYLVSVQALGHAKYYSPAFEISATSLTYTIKNIELQAASKVLAGRNRGFTKAIDRTEN